MNARLTKQFGNYRLLRLLGKGGFSEVYLGEHVYLKTQAAIKILRVRLERDELPHFLQEARVIAHLEHPHIVRVLDFGMEGATPFLVLAYAPHGSLRQRYPRGSALPLASIVRYTREIAGALQYAHSRQLIHGDVKPENMLIAGDERLLLSDFGLAVVAQHSQQTHEQEISGTVAYMAPEQLRGKPGQASDQYALGIVVYEWLCGSRPFNGSFAEIAMQHLHAPPPALPEKTLLPAIEQVVMRALSKEPGKRFASIDEFARALEQAAQPLLASTQAALEENRLPVGEATIRAEATNEFGPHALSTRREWHIPYRRNPYFTAQEAHIERLHALLHDETGSGIRQPVAITGMAGIGKTQMAVEYAYRYQADYTAALWARAESYETLFADFALLAEKLHLAGEGGSDARESVEAVKNWLATRRDWLLMLDNIEDFALLDSFVPSESAGHVLLTTRAQATGTRACALELEKLSPEEGAALLLLRSKKAAPGTPSAQIDDADFLEARDICKLVDGLPLALDQAGAYIEETGCSFYQYASRFRSQRALLLNLRGELSALHPESVSATILLTFEQINRPDALDLLRLCAFLHADAIQEEILIGDAAVQDAGVLDELVATLRKYSLVYRHAEEQALSMHRLVQVIVKDAMDMETRRAWAERAVHAIDSAFPGAEKVTAWRTCERLVPHVSTCYQLIEEWQIATPEAARLLAKAGRYFVEMGQYTRAARFLERALTVYESLGEPGSARATDARDTLATCYLYQGRYDEAEPLYRQVLVAYERAPEGPQAAMAITLNNLALLSYQVGSYSQAESYFQDALRLWEDLHEGAHADFARTLNNLGLLYHKQGRLVEAESFYLRGLEIWEQLHGPVHPDLALQLHNLAVLCYQRGEHTRAEALFQRSLSIREKMLGPEHPAVAYSLVYLALAYQNQWKYTEAEVLMKQALQIRRRALGPEHPETAHSLCSLAKLYSFQGNHTRAESLYQQALRIREQALGPEHPDVVKLLKNYAVLLMWMKRKDEAVQLLARAKAIAAPRS